MRFTQTRFTVTAGAIVVNHQGCVLLLKHRFRAGSGWGIPGGFMQVGEQPEEALRRELREEVGIELDSAEVCLVRAFKRPKQIEILFLCRSKDNAQPQSVEVTRAAWFALNALPEQLPDDQRRLIKRILIDGAKRSG